MADRFDGYSDSVSSPASVTAAITPHATNPLAYTTKGIYVGTGGDITLRCARDSADTLFKAVPAGTILPVRATHVRAAGTTAADLVALA